MKNAIAAVLLLTLGAVASDMSGRWSGEFKVEGGDHSIPQFFILKQQDKILTGSGGPDAGEQYPIENGRIEGDTVKFEVTTGEWKFTYHLERSAKDELQGDLKLESLGESRTAKVSLKRVQEK